MSEGKYGKYFISGPVPEITPPSNGPIVGYLNGELFEGSNEYFAHWALLTPQKDPSQRMPDRPEWGKVFHGPHKHKYPEILVHLGMNPDDPLDLGGEVEMCMGPEMEKHIITNTTFLFIPANFVHAPWIIKKVTRPFIVMEINQSNTHTEQSLEELIPEEDRGKMVFIDQGYEHKERRTKWADSKEEQPPG